MRISHAFLTAAVSTAALLAASGAQAGGFAVREQSATAQGLSFAGAASGSGGLSSMFWNPATITMAPGWNQEAHASFIIPQAEITPVAGTSPLLARPQFSGQFISSGDIARDALVPSTYTSYQINDRIWIGAATTSPLGLVTKPERLYSGDLYARSSRILTYNLDAIVGIKVTDWLSFGAGVSGQYFDVKLKRATSPAPVAGTGILEGDSYGVGFTVGATANLPTGTVIGVGYRSSINHDLVGTQKTPAFSVPIETSLNTPDFVNVGLSQAVTDTVRVHFGFEWQNWSRLKQPAIVALPNPLPIPAGTVVSTLPLNYRDGFFYSVGAEYDWRPDLTFRAGLAYEESPIDTSIRSPRLPDNDRIWASIGATYRYSRKLSFDLAYSHVFVRDTRINIVAGQQEFAGLPFVANVDAQVDIVSAALKYRWDDPAVAIPAAPIVRKY